MWIIDRFEGEYAIIENSIETFAVPKSALPKNAREGDCLEVSISTEETNRRKEKANNLMDKLFRNK